MRIDSEKLSLSLTPAEARALAAFACKEETRPHLNAVAIHWADGAAVATDGHRLLLGNNMSKVDRGLSIVSLASLQQAIKRGGRGGSLVVYPSAEADNHDCVIRVVPSGAAEPIDTDPAIHSHVPSDVHPPPYKSVIPKREDKPTPEVALGLRFFGDVATLGRALNKQAGGVVRFGGDELSPITITVEGARVGSDNDWLLVWMPQRM